MLGVDLWMQRVIVETSGGRWNKRSWVGRFNIFHRYPYTHMAATIGATGPHTRYSNELEATGLTYHPCRYSSHSSPPSLKRAWPQAEGYSDSTLAHSEVAMDVGRPLHAILYYLRVWPPTLTSRDWRTWAGLDELTKDWSYCRDSEAASTSSGSFAGLSKDTWATGWNLLDFELVCHFAHLFQHFGSPKYLNPSLWLLRQETGSCIYGWSFRNTQLPTRNTVLDLCLSSWTSMRCWARRRRSLLLGIEGTNRRNESAAVERN